MRTERSTLQFEIVKIRTNNLQHFYKGQCQQAIQRSSEHLRRKVFSVRLSISTTSDLSLPSAQLILTTLSKFDVLRSVMPVVASRPSSKLCYTVQAINCKAIDRNHCIQYTISCDTIHSNDQKCSLLVTFPS